MSAQAPESLVALDDIAGHRHERINRIASVLGNRLDSSALDYAAAHHLLEGAERAARAQDANLLAWYRERTVRDLLHLSVGPHIALAPRPTDLLRGEISDTAYYLVRPDTTTAPPQAQDLIRAALASAADHGFGTLLTQHAPVICLLNRHDLGDTLHSWTLTRLPGTVFTDYTAHPEILARDLVHEAAHNWLNDALMATACKIDGKVFFHSPWRRTARPAFGFLHACWAFPLTMLYTVQALGRATGELRRFMTAYLDQQRSLLARSSGDHARALELVDNDDLRRRLSAAHAEALAL
ncbi:aKG-HExxH-type peptide beta-hydroxylase [Streptomyces sp. NPDC096198]|uniref:aKG-HExxH-type peptide beta-hydroxylase n=1 Tax=Streptomyces sp. NPDC096198 TaxID=3366080 RepID=UPI0037F47916